MQQNLLIERFKLKVRLQPKDMPIYELTVSERGLKINQSPRSSVLTEQDPWGPPKVRQGRDGYPEFLPGQTGVANLFGKYRWIGTGLSMQEIAKTLSAYAGRFVLDSTGLKGLYNVDVKWNVDRAALMAGLSRQMADSESSPASSTHEGDSGPNLQRAIQDSLGLKLNSKRGRGDIVIVDHIEKVPIAN